MRISKGDVLVAGGALAGIVSGTYAGLSSSGPWERDLDALGLCLITVASLALVFRRAAPVSVGAVTLAAAIVYYAGRYPGVFAAAPALAAIYTAAAQGRRRPAIALAAGFCVIAYTLVALSDVNPRPGDGFTLLSGWLVAMVVAGEVVRGRRAYLREVENRAVEAERTKEEAALRRVGEERLWIAQELHDTLTHTISIMNVQTAVAQQYLDRDPTRARQAMAAVRESGAEAMNELRSTLRVLRTDTAGPDIGLACLSRLVDRVEAAGLPVAASVVGERRDLPVEVDRAAYRIVQEAFTNTLRHAGAASITLITEYRRHSVVVRVEDDGDSRADPPAGHGMGLIGMRERAVAVGGTLVAGPRAGGGFAVRAELPVTAPA
ncbi:sensor histidine kinase [Actinomadura rugatobispora]|uniref:histidine kinase n=1 Tax=Actinomadura rugatobispora TaxID=1994 RepID=A0ABW0ZQA7_9ACTN|nr:histidine kinase [Actinomadura rugatobispora]